MAASGEAQRDVLRPQAEGDLLAAGWLAADDQRGQGKAVVETEVDRLAAAAGDFARHEVHARAADEAGNEQVRRVVVELERRADLLDHAGAQHDDAVGKRHRLDLVVGDEDHGRTQAAVQLVDLDAHLHAQFGVEVRQRFVEQEDLGLAHDGAADGDALALAAGELPRLAVEQLADLENLCRLGDALGDLGLGGAHGLEPEGKVLAHRHVRIERVGLEDHGQSALAPPERR